MDNSKQCFESLLRATRISSQAAPGGAPYREDVRPPWGTFTARDPGASAKQGRKMLLDENRESEDEDKIIIQECQLKPQQVVMSSIGPATNPLSPTKQMDSTSGKTSPGHMEFSPFKLVDQYPWRFVGKARQEEVGQFFKSNIFANRTWDMFYLHDPHQRRDPMILVPSVQFEAFLNTTNAQLGTKLEIPKGNISEIFYITFGDFGSPRPRFMGRVNNEASYKAWKMALGPVPHYDLTKLEANNLQLFKEKMDKAFDSAKLPTKKKNPELERLKRMQKQKAWSGVIKRAQRYLGLRTRTAYAASATKVQTAWCVGAPPPFKPESTVRFVCVDVEAYERSNNIVTEIGIAILDTDDISGVAPGRRGTDWFPLIKAHHLCIKEVSYMVNHEYIKGCPDKFNFGTSEFVSQEDVARRVAEIVGDSDSMDKSPIVVVGHDVGIDLKYLRSIGYNVWKLPQFIDEVDTKLMFQRLQFITDSRGLEFICSELEVPGNNFHNGGNDAVYTMRAMIAMAVLKKLGGLRPASIPWDPRNYPSEAEWSDGEEDDGGLAVKSREPPEATTAKLATEPRDIFKSQKW